MLHGAHIRVTRNSQVLTVRILYDVFIFVDVADPQINLKGSPICASLLEEIRPHEREVICDVEFSVSTQACSLI
jgi:hypothetical protein